MTLFERPILYNYFRSSSSYRVRLALNYKGIPYEYRAIHLLKNGGEQYAQEYLRLNPRGEVPLFVHGEIKVSQSFAILQYLDGAWPDAPLFPKDFVDHIRCVEICQMIGSGIQPLQNLRVQQELEKRFKASAADKESWNAHWNSLGLAALEKELAPTAGQFCLGETLTAADFFLVPQVYSAQRNHVDLSPFPTLRRINENCLKREDLRMAHPDKQLDAPAS